MKTTGYRLVRILFLVRPVRFEGSQDNGKKCHLALLHTSAAKSFSLDNVVSAQMDAGSCMMAEYNTSDVESRGRADSSGLNPGAAVTQL